MKLKHTKMNYRHIKTIRFSAVALCLVTFSPGSVAQTEPRFSVASIRPSADNDPGMVVRTLPNSGYSGRKIPVIALLTSAFGLSPNRIIGAPSRPERYDIEARYEPAPGEIAPPRSLLLQALLRERFGLMAHMEKREFPVYFLRIARNDGRLGPELKPSALNCADASSAPGCAGIERPDAFIASGMTMDVIASALRIPAGRDVINATGLAGAWDVTLEFALPNDTRDERPSVFTAVREQLGLKLESATAPLDVLVVDAIRASPTEN